MGCGKAALASRGLDATSVQDALMREIGWPLKMDDPPHLRQSTRKFARARRQEMTRAETMLWRALRNHQLGGHGFRRQSPIGPYIADFACLRRKLVVETDAGTHETEDAQSRDARRDAFLRHQGYRVSRLPDDLVIGGLQIAIERIRSALGEELA